MSLSDEALLQKKKSIVRSLSVIIGVLAYLTLIRLPFVGIFFTIILIGFYPFVLLGAICFFGFLFWLIGDAKLQTLLKLQSWLIRILCFFVIVFATSLVFLIVIRHQHSVEYSASQDKKRVIQIIQSPTPTKDLSAILGGTPSNNKIEIITSDASRDAKGAQDCFVKDEKYGCIKSETDCLQTLYMAGYYNVEKCLGKIAAVKNQPSICEPKSGEYFDKDKCLFEYAASSGDIGICNSLEQDYGSYQGQRARKECYLHFAVKKDDVSYCEQLRNSDKSEDPADECLSKFAENLNVVEDCKKTQMINGKPVIGQQSKCKSAIAMGDNYTTPEICRMIKNPSQQASCVDDYVRDGLNISRYRNEKCGTAADAEQETCLIENSPCNDIDSKNTASFGSYGESHTIKMHCDVDYFNKSGLGHHGCNSLKDSSRKLECLTMLYKDYSRSYEICEEFADQIIKDQCKMAIFSRINDRNPEICESMEANKTQNSCYSALVRNSGAGRYCLLTGGINEINDCIFDTGEDLFSTLYKATYYVFWHLAIFCFLYFRISAKCRKKLSLISLKRSWFLGFFWGIVYLGGGIGLFSLLERKLNVEWLFLPVTEADNWLCDHFCERGGGWIDLFPDPNEFLVFLLLPLYFGFLALMVRHTFKKQFNRKIQFSDSILVKEKKGNSDEEIGNLPITINNENTVAMDDADAIKSAILELRSTKSDEEIKAALIDQGWNEEAVKKVIENMAE